MESVGLRPVCGGLPLELNTSLSIDGLQVLEGDMFRLSKEELPRHGRKRRMA